MKDFQKFYDFMSEYTVFWEDIRKKEEEKFKALYSRDRVKTETVLAGLPALEESIRLYEKKRLALNDEMGLTGKTLKQVVIDSVGEERVKLTELHARLKLAVDTVKEYNLKSLEFAQMNIDIVNKINGDVVESPTYSPKGLQDRTARPSIINTKI
jgi:hypothetical protein